MRIDIYNNDYVILHEHFGDKTPIVAMEECGECIQAISKMERDELAKVSGMNSPIRTNLIEEMADVLIAIGLLSHHYDIPDQHLRDMVEYKMKRNIERCKIEEMRKNG